MLDAPPPTISRCLWMFALGVIGCSFPSRQSQCVSDPASCLDAGVRAPGTGSLGKECTRDADCRSSLRLSCSDGNCGFAADLAQGEPCHVTNECADGLFCELAGATPSCAPAGVDSEGARCEATADCQRGLLCGFSAEGLTKRCLASGTGDLGAACSTTTDCLAGLTCTLGDQVEATCSLWRPVGELPATWSGVKCGAEASADTAYFRLPRASVSEDFFRLPFPNDARRSASGLDLSGFPTPGAPLGNGIDTVARYRDESASLSGFSTNPVVYFRFSSAYAGVNDESVLLFDISKSSASYGSPLSRGWGTSSGKVTQYVCPNWLNVGSKEGSPLRPGTTYAAILTREIKTRAGGAFTRDADLDSLLSDAAPGDALLEPAHAAYAPLRAFLADKTLSHGLDVDSVLNAAVFTTHDPNALAQALFEDVRGQAPAVVSELSTCGFEANSACALPVAPPCTSGNAAYIELHGRIALPIYQSGEAPYTSEGGTIALDDVGRPMVVRSEEVCFALAIPKSALPRAGFPLLIYGHGTGGSYRSALADFSSLAPSAAIMSIDLPQHGSRKAGSTLGSDELFFNFSNPGAALGNVLQGSADLLALVRWASTVTLPGTNDLGRSVRFDPARIALFGHSQGATHASLLVPYAPELAGVVLSGVGGDLSAALVSKKSPIDIASLVPLLVGDPEAAQSGSCPSCIGASHPVYGLVQNFLDRVDPVNFGKLAALGRAGPAHLFMTFGVGDSYAPDATQKAYALSADLPLVAPELLPVDQKGALPAPVSLNVGVMASSATQGVRQYQGVGGDDPHFVYQSSAREDVERFLSALLSGTAPVIGK